MAFRFILEARISVVWSTSALVFSAIVDRTDWKILLLHSEVNRATLAVTSLATSASVPLGKQKDLQPDSI